MSLRALIAAQSATESARRENRASVSPDPAARRPEGDAPLTPCRRDACHRSLDMLGRRIPSPGGRFENSPAVHCRVRMRHPTRPEGTDESIECHESVHTPVLMAEIQPSLRDVLPLIENPTLEKVRYSQFSLREKAHETSVLAVQARTEKRPTSSGRFAARADERPVLRCCKTGIPNAPTRRA